jgi:hypothetical protein
MEVKKRIEIYLTENELHHLLLERVSSDENAKGYRLHTSEFNIDYENKKFRGVTIVGTIIESEDDD